MAGYDLRLRLQLAAGQDVAWVERVFNRLERLGLADDFTEPDEDGTFVIWCSLLGDSPQGVLSETCAAIREAETAEQTCHSERTRGRLDFLSIDISKSLNATETSLPA